MLLFLPQVRTLPKVLKYLPSDKAQDARNYVNSLQYWLGGNDGQWRWLLIQLLGAGEAGSWGGCQVLGGTGRCLQPPGKGMNFASTSSFSPSFLFLQRTWRT